QPAGSDRRDSRRALLPIALGSCRCEGERLSTIWYSIPILPQSGRPTKHTLLHTPVYAFVTGKGGHLRTVVPDAPSGDENGDSFGMNLEMRGGGGDDLAVGIHRHFARGLDIKFPAAGRANLLPRSVATGTERRKKKRQLPEVLHLEAVEIQMPVIDLG